MATSERGRLEEVVYGPPGRYDAADVARATARLRLLLAHESSAPTPPAEDDGHGRAPDGRRLVLVAGAAVLAAAVLVGVVGWVAARHPEHAIDVFDRAQTAADVTAGAGVRGALATTIRRLDAPAGVTAVAYRDNPLDVCLWVRGRSSCVSELRFRRDGVRVVGYRWGPDGTAVLGPRGD